MRTMVDMIHELEEAAQKPAATVLKAMKDHDKKAVGCFPIYAPEEIVYAAGMLPVGLWGGPTAGSMNEKYLQSFCCSIMKANTEQAMKGQYDFLSGIVLTTYCDTMKCVMEDWKTAAPQLKLIPMVYPQNRKLAVGKEFMKEEFQRVLSILEGISGKKAGPEELSASVELYEDYRRTMREFVRLAGCHPTVIGAKSRHLLIKAAYFMDKRDYTEKMKRINEGLSGIEEKNGGHKKRVVLTGLISEPTELLSILDENGLIVSGDDLAHESRQFRTAAPAEGEPFSRMAERMAAQDGCAFLYDEKKSRGRMLVELCKETKADGMIVIQLKFCDPEEFDYPIYKKELEAAGIPMLYLEVEQQMESVEQLRTRIQSFAEILHG